jgi:hypothetical protein
VNSRTPYWWAFLKHPANQAIALGTLAASLLLSLPWGGDGFGLGMLALAAIEMVGLATVPGLAAFQAHVDKQDRFAARKARRERLLKEIEANGGSPHLRSYEQMCARVATLYGTASERGTTLTEREVEQLDDLTVGYLQMCLSDALTRGDDKAAQANGLVRKLDGVERRLADADLGSDEAQALQRAKAEYEEAIARHNRIVVRRSALEASLVSTPVRLEEVHQMVMASPQGVNLGQMLEESISKLRLVEEAALDLEHTVDPLQAPALPLRSGASAEAQRQGSRRAVGQKR